jgi:hypothetical protein
MLRSLLPNPSFGLFYLTMTDFSTTLIRCSALGMIMGNQKGKTPLDKYNDALGVLAEEYAKYEAMPNKDLKSAINKQEKIKQLEIELEVLKANKDEVVLSDTCKSYLIQSYVLEKYGRVKEVITKQMAKGIIAEDNSIELFNNVDGNNYTKNDKKIKNEFISGTPDLFDGDDIHSCNEIIDIKSSWDIFTFLSNVTEPIPTSYYWQLQGYMALSGAKIGTIAYCLVNTPDSIIEGEKYNLLRRMDVATEEDPTYIKEVTKLERNRLFNDIPKEERVLTISIDRNEADIEKIYAKVLKCREFIAAFEKEHLFFSKHFRKKILPLQ